jgi:8-oxo-dGTP diphosphatase
MNAERRTKNPEPRAKSEERRRKNEHRQVRSPPPAMTTLLVVAAIIERDDAYLVTCRQPGVHLAGHWEFPGGKCQAGETLDQGLARELREELAVDAVVGVEIFTTSHDYPDRRVELHFFRCDLLGQPTPQQGQEMRWVRRDALRTLRFPPADSELIELLGRLAGSRDER